MTRPQPAVPGPADAGSSGLADADSTPDQDGAALAPAEMASALAGDEADTGPLAPAGSSAPADPAEPSGPGPDEEVAAEDVAAGEVDAGEVSVDAAPATRMDPPGAAAAGPSEAAAALPAQLLDGRLLDNRYRLIDRIATGGMGQVWRGTDELLGRPVAVKLLSARNATDEQFRTRFRAEARYAASLSHPGIARVFDYGESAGGAATGDPVSGVPYLVMELVEGEPLSAAIARDGRMTADVTLDLVAQAAQALTAAHAAGIVHRDIKPGNLLITPEHQVKITDFGIARAALAAHAARLTQTGMVMGTAQYVSPEQASARPVTAATDIYSLGVVAYECLAGRPPFTADAPIALALAHVSKRPPALPADVPPPVAALVGQMLAKEPADRPASAQAVAERATAIKAALADGGDSWDADAAAAEPSTWFSDSGPADPAVDYLGTAPMAGGPARPGRVRHSGRRVLAAAAVLLAAGAGTAAGIAASRHPAAPALTGGAPAHQATTHSRRSARTPGLIDEGSRTPQLAPSRPVASSHPSTSPSASPSPSPTVSSSPSPTTSPTGTTSPSPPPTSTSPSPTPTQTSAPAQVPLAGLLIPVTKMQDG